MADPASARPLEGKLVTLIGGGGFIGRYAAQALMKAGARVRVAQRDPRRAYRLRALGGLGQTQFVAAAVRRPETVARALAGADAAVNLVGVFEGNLMRVHVDGARAVAEAAARGGLDALVHVSAIGADARGDSVYARTKGLGEQAVREAFAGATILRPSTVFGPEDQFVNRFAAMIARLPVVPVLRAEARFQPVFVGDVAQAIVAGLADPLRHAGRTFELGGPQIVTMMELHEAIAADIGRAPKLLPLPDAVGATLAMLPGTPISADQWRMLGHDAVVAQGTPGLDELGVRRTPLSAIAPGWLVRYRKAGRFGTVVNAKG